MPAPTLNTLPFCQRARPSPTPHGLQKDRCFQGRIDNHSFLEEKLIDRSQNLGK